MKKYFVALLMFVSAAAAAQRKTDVWKALDADYRPYAITDMLKKERAHAIEIEKSAKMPHYYFKSDRYRFKATVMGGIAPMDADVFNSAKRVYKLTGGNPAILDPLFKKAVLMKVGNEQIWMPIQNAILDGFKDDLGPGDEVTVYCLYFNEHTAKNVSYNSFLISAYKPVDKKTGKK